MIGWRSSLGRLQRKPRGRSQLGKMSARKHRRYGAVGHLSMNACGWRLDTHPSDVTVCRESPLLRRAGPTPKSTWTSKLATSQRADYASSSELTSFPWRLVQHLLATDWESYTRAISLHSCSTSPSNSVWKIVILCILSAPTILNRSMYHKSYIKLQLWSKNVLVSYKPLMGQWV